MLLSVRSHAIKAYFIKFAEVSGLHVSLATVDKGIFDKVGIRKKRGTSSDSRSCFAVLQSDKG